MSHWKSVVFQTRQKYKPFSRQDRMLSTAQVTCAIYVIPHNPSKIKFSQQEERDSQITILCSCRYSMRVAEIEMQIMIHKQKSLYVEWFSKASMGSVKLFYMHHFSWNCTNHSLCTDLGFNNSCLGEKKVLLSAFLILFAFLLKPCFPSKGIWGKKNNCFSVSGSVGYWIG